VAAMGPAVFLVPRVRRAQSFLDKWLAERDLQHLKRQALLFSRVAVIVPERRFKSDLRESREEFKSYLRSMLGPKATR
jgi:hypothetical protein